MKAQVESISPVKAKLFVEVSAEELGQQQATAFRDLQRSVTVPGFRKGKAPIPVLKRIYGDRVRADAMSQLVEKTYLDALRAEGIVPVSDADINLETATDEGGIAYTAVVEVRPTVEPRGYSGLSLKKEAVDISETEVDARLETMRREHANFEPASEDREAEEGDMVVVDYEGAIGGEPFEGGTGEGRTLILGSGMFIPGFEEGLRGSRGGEERTLELDFPEDYRAVALAGKHAQFQIRVKEVKVRRLPELDDEFARETAKVETLAELRDRVREVAMAEKSHRAESEFRERVIDSLLQANPFEVPESLVARQQARALDSLRQDLAQRGIDLDSAGIDRRELQENYRRGSERAVRWAFLLNALAKAETVEVSDADVETRLRAIAEADGRPYSLIRSFFDEGERLDSLRSSLLEQKVIDHVVTSSTVELVSREELKAAGLAHE
ncbi:MAG: trigger factor [Deltaproteobacteria bacterium]|nr:trigger factor [Deltaproteobacteria bacterium]